MELFLNFILLVLSAVGLSHILADSSIVAPLKFWINGKGWWGEKLVEMLNCYQCNGWWSGLITYFIYLSSPYLDWLMWAFAISLVSPLIGYLKLWISMQTTVEEEWDDEPEEGDNE